MIIPLNHHDYTTIIPRLSDDSQPVNQTSPVPARFGGVFRLLQAAVRGAQMCGMIWDDLGTNIFLHANTLGLSDNNLLWYRGFSIARLNYQRSKSKYGHHVLTVEGTILHIFHHSDFLKDTNNRKGHRTFLAGQGLELWPWPDSPSATGCHDGIGLSRAHRKRSVIDLWKPKWWVHVWFANYHHLLSGCLVYKSGNPPEG